MSNTDYDEDFYKEVDRKHRKLLSDIEEKAEEQVARAMGFLRCALEREFGRAAVRVANLEDIEDVLRVATHRGARVAREVIERERTEESRQKTAGLLKTVLGSCINKSER